MKVVGRRAFSDQTLLEFYKTTLTIISGGAMGADKLVLYWLL